MSEYVQGLYIAQLSEQRQQAIEAELHQSGVERHEIDYYMMAKVADILDVINVENVLLAN